MHDLVKRLRQLAEPHSTEHEAADEIVRLREAMQEFVDRCDKGQVLSKYTYRRFKELLP